MNLRWPWRRQPKEGPDVMRQDEHDRDERLAAAEKAAEQSEKLIARVHQLAPVVEAHTGVSRRLRRDNGFAYILYNEAFRGKSD